MSEKSHSTHAHSPSFLKRKKDGKRKWTTILQVGEYFCSCHYLSVKWWSPVLMEVIHRGKGRKSVPGAKDTVLQITLFRAANLVCVAPQGQCRYQQRHRDARRADRECWERVSNSCGPLSEVRSSILYFRESKSKSSTLCRCPESVWWREQQKKRAAEESHCFYFLLCRKLEWFRFNESLSPGSTTTNWVVVFTCKYFMVEQEKGWRMLCSKTTDTKVKSMYALKYDKEVRGGGGAHLYS